MEDKTNSKEITLDSLIEGNNDNVSILYQFSNFIASNPDFKYNSTYLTDEIDKFIKDRALFEKKTLFFIEIIESIENIEKLDIDILFDNVFCINILENDCLNRDEICYEGFRFDKIGSKEVVIEFISNGGSDNLKSDKSTFLISNFEIKKEKMNILKKYKEFIKQIKK